MKVSTKKRLILIFFLLTWLPFLLLTDLYPFLRFGMFAEPIRGKETQEVFVLYTEKNNRLEKYDTYFWGIDEGVFNYLARKYYYQKRLGFFGETLCSAHRQLYPNTPQKWLLYRQVTENGYINKELVAVYETTP